MAYRSVCRSISGNGRSASPRALKTRYMKFERHVDLERAVRASEGHIITWVDGNRFQEASIIFNNAIQTFRESLSDAERLNFREFESPGAMVEDIQQHCEKFFKDRKLTRFCRRIQIFASAWEPFFEITNIFVSTHPDWAGIAWGAIRLVFIVRSNQPIRTGIYLKLMGLPSLVVTLLISWKN
jgi:hypothetical protein